MFMWRWGSYIGQQTITPSDVKLSDAIYMKTEMSLDEVIIF